MPRAEPSGPTRAENAPIQCSTSTQYALAARHLPRPPARSVFVICGHYQSDAQRFRSDLRTDVFRANFRRLVRAGTTHAQRARVGDARGRAHQAPRTHPNSKLPRRGSVGPPEWSCRCDSDRESEWRDPSNPPRRHEQRCGAAHTLRRSTEHEIQKHRAPIEFSGARKPEQVPIAQAKTTHLRTGFRPAPDD